MRRLFTGSFVLHACSLATSTLITRILNRRTMPTILNRLLFCYEARHTTSNLSVRKPFVFVPGHLNENKLTIHFHSGPILCMTRGKTSDKQTIHHDLRLCKADVKHSQDMLNISHMNSRQRFWPVSINFKTI